MLDNLFGKKPLIPPLAQGFPLTDDEQKDIIDKRKKAAETQVIQPEVEIKEEKKNKIDYKKELEKVKAKLLKEEPKKEEPKTPSQDDIEWFYKHYGQTFQAQETSANDQVIINLLFGILIEIRDLNKKVRE